MLDVLEMLALISIHSLTTGLPMLYGAEEFPRPEQTQGRYWDDFEARVPGFNGMLAHALPGVFTAYRELGRTLWRSGARTLELGIAALTAYAEDSASERRGA